MAQIPAELCSELSDKLDALSDSGRELVERAVLAAEWDTIAELREVAIEALDMVCEANAATAAVLASDFYDDVRTIATGEALGIVAEPAYDREATEKAVRGMVQSVVDGSTVKAFAAMCGDRADYIVKRAAGEAVYDLGERDDADVRFARVPSGIDTCPFCIMLASRGFVYRSKKSAGVEKGHYHANCRCRIVPGFNGLTKVEGYDTDDLYKQYMQDIKDGKLDIKGASKYSSHTLHWSSGQFKSYGDFSKFVKDAKDIEDLQLRCAVAEKEWGKTGLSDRYYKQLRQAVMAKKRELGKGHGEPRRQPRAADGYSIPIAKLERYALDPNGDADKAAAFKSALGYTKDDAQEVMRKVQRYVSDHDPTFRDSTEYGDRYTTDMVMSGKDGRSAKVRIGWILRNGESKMSLTTIYVDK